MNVSASSTNPAGGNIDRFENSKKANGLVQETAMYPFVGNMFQILNSKQAEYFERTQNYYAENGFYRANR